MSVTLAGCASSEADNAVDTGETDSDIVQVDGNEQLESGKVELKIWVEEANFANMQKMIDSFEQKYAGQADFEITMESSADADTRQNVLGDIHNAADIFSMPDDQLYSMIAGGALSPVVNQDEVKSANLADAVSKVPAIAAVIEQSQYGVLQRVGNSYWDACSTFANTIIG